MTLRGSDEPVRRFFGHAIDEGAAIGGGVLLTMTGRIKVGLWLRLAAEQTSDARSFMWRARVGPGPVAPLTVVDRYADGAGSTAGRLFGRATVFRGGANTITISGVTIREGRVVAASGSEKGGGLWNQDATLRLTDVVIAANEVNTDGAVGGAGGISDGGAIANDSGGTLTLLRAEVTGNRASARGGGGTAGTDGKAGGIARGGALHNAGTLSITDSAFAANTVSVLGGQGSNANDGGPGGIAQGGSAFVESGSRPASIASSTFSGNAVESSGGLPGAGGASGPGGISQGGGLHVSASSPIVPFTNVTVVGNAARTGPGGLAQGGGLHGSGSGSGRLVLTNATLASNTASGSLDAKGGNLRANPGVEVRNTILSSGTAMTGTENCALPPTSLGHNLENTNPSQCGLGAAGDRIGVDPLLGALQANGGPARTTALSAASPAIDAADPDACPAADARGVKRPQRAACDIGAYEAAPPATTTGSASAADTTSATVAGTATNPDALSGEITFQYGPTATYGQSTASQAVPASSSTAPFTSRITGLPPGTTVHFRAVVSNASGSAFGSDQTFVTAVPAPVATGPAPLRPSAQPSRPLLSALSLSPSTFRARRSGASVAAKTGTTVRFTLSKPARVVFRVERATKGRRVGSTCVKATRSNARRRACTRYTVLAGSFTAQGKQGPNRLGFRGRLGGRTLSSGRYRLRIVAQDTAGARSAVKRLRFRVVRR